MTAPADRTPAVNVVHPAQGAPVVTLTVNPALDVSTSTERVEPEHKLRCGPSRTDAGGGGVNVSRVIHRLGGQSIAIYAVGGPTGQAYRQLLEADELSTGRQFRFVLQGPHLTTDEWIECLAATQRAMTPGGYVVASGSLSPGMPDDFYARIARAATAIGARCIVDASGPALAAALREGVHLVKPSGRELGELVGRALPDLESRVEAAREIVARGASEIVALTLGGDGAVLVTAEGVTRLEVPPVEVHSTVGAGDSFLAALVLRLAQGRDLDAAFRAGVAAGTATAMTEATELCHRDDVERLEAQLLAARG